MDEITVRKKLRAAGLRITYPRLALVLELSRSHTQPKSAAELSATLSQFPRSSVYRNLEALESAGLIRSSMVKWVRRYELGDMLAPHHHHVTCISCEKVTDFDSHKLERALEDAAAEAGYQIAEHAVELRGICSDCRNDDNDQSAARTMLEYGFKSMKRLRPRDPLMEKLKQEDTYSPFDTDDR
ncbi:MAG: Fur family transcriptional regulator [Candidatus Saccharimonadales bacterium]